MFEPYHESHSATLISHDSSFDVEVCHLLRRGAEGGTRSLLSLSPPQTDDISVCVRCHLK